MNVLSANVAKNITITRTPFVRVGCCCQVCHIAKKHLADLVSVVGGGAENVWRLEVRSRHSAHVRMFREPFPRCFADTCILHTSPSFVHPFKPEYNEHYLESFRSYKYIFVGVRELRWEFP